jgi:diguanylate cyclase (GGDEF)-like protein
MALVFIRIIFSLLFPGGVLVAAAFAALRLDPAADFVREFFWIFPYPVLLTGLLLAWRFHKSRLLYGVVFFVLTDALLLRFAAGEVMELTRTDFIYRFLLLLLPLNIMGYSLWKERGIFTLRGGLRLILIILQPFMVAGFYLYRQAEALHYLSFEPVQIPYADLELSLPAVVLNLAALLLTFTRFVRYRDPMDHGFFWSFTLALIALLTEDPGFVSSFYFSVCGLILMVAALEAAHGMAYRDELTGLPGRRALNDVLLMMRGIYTVAMLDIDFFKKFNDRHGHDVGDQVLRMVAGKVKQVSGGGKAYRYGGEEFTLIFPGKTKDEALPHLEKLRQTVAHAGFVIRGAGRPKKKPNLPRLWGKKQKVSVTVSIGLAQRESRRQHPHDLIKSADKALYRAKNSGRNRVAK